MAIILRVAWHGRFGDEAKIGKISGVYYWPFMHFKWKIFAGNRELRAH